MMVNELRQVEIRTETAFQDCLEGGGEMGALMRSLDWSKTAIGPVESWSPALRMMVRVLLANRFPMLLWWGPRYVQLYNDAYRPILGDKHPKSMGQPTSECWSEIWHIIGPLIDTPFHGGPATWMEDIQLEINRRGFVEETHYTISYSPVPDETAPRGIGGVLATVHEITEKLVGERRVTALRDLGARASGAKSAEEACTAAAQILAAHDRDIPFALLYLIDSDGQQVRLAGAAGVPMGNGISPLAVKLSQADNEGWPFGQALRTERMHVVEHLGARFDSVPPGPWSDPPDTAVVLPIASNRAHELVGFLVAGVSARLKFDELYRSFFDLVTTQVATAIANAPAYEEERKRAEALAELDRAKTAFFSNVSHEFRTPLTLMLGPLEDTLTGATTALSTEDRERLTVAHRNSLRLLKLVNTLLDFSRIEAGRVQASYEPTDLASFTTDLASVFRSAIERAGMRLTIDCPPVPEPVYVDRDMWEKIVLNLLSNAFKFTFEGEITITLIPTGDRVELRVRDTGIGIPPDELPRLFERFHRVEGVRGRTYEGTGIGLALVQELVKLHGGSVQVESMQGVGSTFTVSVPLGSAHLPADRIGAARTLASTALGANVYVEEALRWLPENRETSDGVAPTPALAEEVQNRSTGQAAERPRLVLADDNAHMRDYLRRLLATSYDVEAVPDGGAALAAVRRDVPALLLTDVMMPKLDGFGLLRELRNDPQTRAIPVILLSARAGGEARVEGLEAGADDYLIKPFSARKLLACVSGHVKMARLRRETEELLHRSEERFRAMLDALPAAIYTTDAEGRLTYFNPAAVEFSGRTPELGSDQWCVTWKLYHDDGTPMRHDECPMAIALKEGRIVHGVEAVAERPDGKRLWFTPYPSPLYDGAGRIVGGINMLVDITERKRAEEALREGEERLAAEADALARLNEASSRLWRLGSLSEGLGEMLSATIELLGADLGNIQLLDAARGVLAIVSQHGFQEEFLDFFREVSTEDDSACGRALRSGERRVIGDIEVDAPYAPLRPIARAAGYRAVQSTPIIGRDGKPLGMLSTHWRRVHRPSEQDLRRLDLYVRQAADFIERCRTDQALRDANERLAEADRRKDEFLAMLAHELRNPLAPILNAVQIQGVLEPTDPRIPKQREVIRRQLEQMKHLLDDLLDVSRITRDKIELRPERLELAAVLSEAVETCRPLIEQKQHQLTVSLPPETIWLEVDRTRIAEVLTNLLNNAAKYTDPGGQIWLSARLDGGQVLVRVRDTGIGMSKEALAHVFDLFHQAERSLDRAQGGLGIGLTIVRRLVEMHGGEVSAHSAGPGTGSEFVVRLPVLAIEHETNRKRTEGIAVRAASSVVRRILVVDDNADAAESLAELLELDGHEVFCAHDGREAMDAARAHQPELILLDIGLPGRNGYEVARELRAAPDLKQPVLVAISGYGQDGDRQRSQEAGFQHHLVKPVDFATLQALVECLPGAQAAVRRPTMRGGWG